MVIKRLRKRRDDVKYEESADEELPESAIKIRKIEPKSDIKDFGGNYNSRAIDRRYPGCHVSIAGGITNSIENALSCHAASFAIFLGSQRSWKAKELTKKDAEEFKALCRRHGFDKSLVLPHAPYLINMGSNDAELREKSYNRLVSELKNAEMLGLELYNIHPGSGKGETSKASTMKRIANMANRALAATSSVKIVYECTAGGGQTIGRSFEELHTLVELTKDKSRVGVCLDTCHMFAAGYDIRTEDSFNKVMAEFDKIVGLKYLLAFHLNDSLTELGSNKDRHANIGKGKIGEKGFKAVMKSSHSIGVPLILETIGPYDEEIELLKGLYCS